MNTSGSVRARRARRLPAFIATLACTVGALAVLQLGETGADALTPATCHTVADPLGPATGWTEFIRNDAFRGSSESEGAAAYGGNLSGSGARNVGIHLPDTTPVETPTLVVGGTLSGTVNLDEGSAYVGSGGTVNFNGGAGAGHLASNPIDFAAAFTELQTISTSWAGATTTGSITSPSDPVNGYLELVGSNTDLNVFNLTQSDFPGGNGGVRIKAPVGAMTIINVAGSTVDLPANPQKIELWINGSWQQASASPSSDDVVRGIVWNFPTATQVNIRNGGPFPGTVLAPNAHVSVANDTGHTVGQMIAKSFSSDRETHLPLFLDEGCVPGTPPPAGDSNVKITKTASDASPHGGDTVTYDLLVENIGASPATGVVVTDVLPGGVTFDDASPGCSFAAGTVTCAVGTLAAGGSTTLWIKVVANPVAGAGPVSHPQANHWLTPYKKEQQVDLEADEYETVTLSCDPGDILADGQFRIDHVDQDTGTIAHDVEILSSQQAAPGFGTWKGVIHNGATGRAQAKAFIVCLPDETEPADRQTGYNDSHRHPLSVDPAAVTHTAAYGAGQHSATLTCPSGTIPVAPGFDAGAGGVVLTGSEYDENHPRDWVFTIDVDVPTTVTFSARCLRTTVGPVYGHTHDLRFTHLVQTVTVSGNTAKEGDEFKVICPDDAKGIVATWDLPPGVQHFGNDPRLKERAFRLFNSTGHAQQATIDLLCLRDRTSTERMGTTDPVVVTNTASVVSASTDANPHNNSSSVSITVQPGSSTTGLTGSGLVSGGTFSLKVASSMPGKGALTVRSGGALLAKGTVGLKPGKAATARLKLTWAGKAKLAKLDKVKVKVDPTRGRTTSRTVRVVR